jgi:hypothetical protein
MWVLMFAAEAACMHETIAYELPGVYQLVIGKGAGVLSILHCAQQHPPPFSALTCIVLLCSVMVAAGL